MGAPRLATPPDCQIQDRMMTPFSARKAPNFCPTAEFFHAAPCAYELTNPGIRPMFSSAYSPPA